MLIYTLIILSFLLFTGIIGIFGMIIFFNEGKRPKSEKFGYIIGAFMRMVAYATAIDYIFNNL